MTASKINFDAIVQITDEHFAQLRRVNPDAKFERTAKGESVIVAPTGGETGRYNSEMGELTRSDHGQAERSACCH